LPFLVGGGVEEGIGGVEEELEKEDDREEELKESFSSASISEGYMYVSS